MEVPTLDPVRDYAHRVAMYDMDRTITRSGTYSGFLMHVARRRQQWRLLLLPLVALAAAAYSLRLIDRSRLKAINLRLLVGKSFNRAEIAPLAESYADQVIARGVHAAQQVGPVRGPVTDWRRMRPTDDAADLAHADNAGSGLRQIRQRCPGRRANDRPSAKSKIASPRAAAGASQRSRSARGSRWPRRSTSASLSI